MVEERTASAEAYQALLAAITETANELRNSTAPAAGLRDLAEAYALVTGTPTRSKLRTV
jgi:hypothetical protein